MWSEILNKVHNGVEAIIIANSSKRVWCDLRLLRVSKKGDIFYNCSDSKKTSYQTP